jgi:hypothetical protein
MKTLLTSLFVLALSATTLHSQCNVTIMSNNVAVDTIEICIGDSIELYAQTNCGGLFFEDFESGYLGTKWYSYSAPVLFNNPCPPTNPPASGTVCWMHGVDGTQRQITTVPLNIPAGASNKIEFTMKYGDVETDDYCEDPDQSDEGVHLQYSTNGGITWIDINYWTPTTNMSGPLYTWNQYSESIPPIAFGSNTQFRWHQEMVSGSNYDHWGIDNVEINFAGYIVVNWSTGDTTLYPAPIYPQQSGYIVCEVYDFFHGSQGSDSVYVVVEQVSKFNVTGGGSYCVNGAGVEVGLDGSEIDNTYQLFINAYPVSNIKIGTGGPISFGNQTTAGTYTVKANQIASGCSDMMNGNAIVNITSLPVANAGANQIINNGSSTTLNGSAASGTPPYTWNWTPATMINGSASIQNPQTVNLGVTQVYQLVVNDSIGCSDDDVAIISVTGGALTANPYCATDTVCEGSTIWLLANPGGGTGNYSCSWTSSPVGFTSILQNPTTSPNTTKTYIVTVDDGASTATGSVTVVVIPAPFADAGPDASVCENGTYMLNGSGTDYTTVNWSSTGDGYFDDNTIENAVYTPGVHDISIGHVYLSMIANGNIPCGQSSDFMKLSVIRNPVMPPLQDADICAGDSINLFGLAYHWNLVLWSTTGDGSFSNAANLYPVYTPGINDIVNGAVTLSLTAFGFPPCNINVTSSMQLNIHPNPAPSVSGPKEVCAFEKDVIYTTPFVPGHSYSWGISGGNITTGPATNQVTVDWGGMSSSGSLTVTETDTLTGCVTEQIYDSIKIRQLPIASAGPDQFIPGNSATQLNGSVIGGSGHYTYDWSPDSLLVDPTVEDPFTEILNSTTKFHFIATDSITGCVSFEDDVTVYNSGTLSINPVAIPDTICIGDSSTLFPNVGGGSGIYSYTWSSNPPGFSSTIQSPVVKPLVTTTYHLTVSDGFNTIAGSASVTVVPSANAGPDDVICTGNTYNLNGSVYGQSFFYWSTSGDGYFNDSVILSPEYTPGMGDNASGSVVLTLHVTGAPPCNSIASSSMTLSIQHLPTANAGPDVNICEGKNIIPGGSAINYNSVFWTSTGDGSFNNSNILNPTYTPGPGDINTGTANLILEADAISPCNGVSVDTMVMNIVKLPVVNLGNDTTICKNDSITLDAGNPGCNYTWSTNATTQKITVTSHLDAIISYYVIVTNSDGCLSTGSITVTYVTCTSIDIAGDAPSINLFPNPNNGKCRLAISNASAALSTGMQSAIVMEIMNIHGQKIFDESIIRNTSTFIKEIDLTMFPKGVYFINFRGKGFTATRKLVIK